MSLPDSLKALLLSKAFFLLFLGFGSLLWLYKRPSLKLFIPLLSLLAIACFSMNFGLFHFVDLTYFIFKNLKWKSI